MKNLLLLIILATTVTACTSVKRSARPETINRLASTGVSSVTLQSGLTVSAEALQVTADSTFWRSPRTLKVTSFPTDQITSITYRSRSTGLFKGMRNGMLVGGAIMGLAGAVSNRTCPTNQAASATGEFGLPCSSAVGGLAGALWGAFWGATLGGLTGSAAGGKLRFRLHR
ncbi:MAG: hypothetical protein ACI80V_001825 [Rhodothermales bacterium]|jgi:hypothetical protein